MQVVRLVICTALLTNAAAGATPELWNGGFEAQGTVVGKQVPGWTGDAGAIVACDDRPYSGRYCARLVHPHESTATWVRTADAPVEPGQLHVFRLAYRKAEAGSLYGLLFVWSDRKKQSYSRVQRWFQPLRGVRWKNDGKWHVMERIIKVPRDARSVRLSLALRGQPSQADVDELHFGPVAKAPVGMVTDLALSAQAKTWEPSTGQIQFWKLPHRLTSVYGEWWEKLYAPQNVNDGDDRTYWTSNVPTAVPPKDIGLEWKEPVALSAVLVKYVNRDVEPSSDGHQLQTWAGSKWGPVPHARLTREPSRCYWLYTFDAIQTTRIRVLLTKFAKHRPAVKEIMAFANVPKCPLVAWPDSWDYTHAPEEPDGKRERVPLVFWYTPARGIVSTNVQRRMLATGTDAEGKPMSKEAATRATRDYLHNLRGEGADGLLVNLGLNPLSAESVGEQMLRDYRGTQIGAVEHIRMARRLGIEHNFALLYLFAIGRQTWKELDGKVRTVKLSNGRPTLDWTHDASWEPMWQTVAALAGAARQAGAKGVAFDVEPYITGVPIYQSKSYSGQSADALVQAAERRGRELGQTIVSAFPGSEIILLAGYARPDWDVYNALWRGLSSVPSGGVHIFTEFCYTTHDPEAIRRMYDATWRFHEEHAGNAGFWRSRCSVAMGSMPVWPAADRVLSPRQLRQQLRAFGDMSPRPRYRWLYTGGWVPWEDADYAGFQDAFRR